ncbi:hypothetical protein HF086_017241 [Spodoptera exigua]|uniref:Uncharacterized protein n=1 Tax=Spodoptera exigua TaxID=7107 RepID=A0A922SMT1_SPOEX|nr:hypothetical protein HF086_017241 [Spodoptera exigua]
MYHTPAESPQENMDVAREPLPTTKQRSVAPENKKRRNLEPWERGSPELAPSPKSPQPAPTFESRTVEARYWLKQAKCQLGLARNLKTDIKTQVTQAIERLYQLVKEPKHQGLTEGGGVAGLVVPAPEIGGRENDLLTKMAEHGELLKAATVQIEELKGAIFDQRRMVTERVAEGHSGQSASNELLAEVQELKSVTREMGRQVSEMRAEVPTYAEVLSKPKNVGRATRPKHSVVVSSGDAKETSGDVVGRVRRALDAKVSGLQVQQVRKVKDQRVVLSCDNKDELEKMTARLRADDQLRVENAPWPGLAWPGLAWPGLAWPGLAWPGLAWPGLAWPGLAWPGLAWPGLAWPGLA